MSWLGGTISSLTGQLSNLTKEVLSEGREEVEDSQTELGIAHERIRYLERQCSIQKQEIDRQRIAAADLEERCQAAELQITAISSQYRSIIQKKEEEIKRLKLEFQELVDKDSKNVSTSSSSGLAEQIGSDFENVSCHRDILGVHQLSDSQDWSQPFTENLKRVDTSSDPSECSFEKTGCDPDPKCSSENALLSRIQELTQKLQLTIDEHQHQLASLQDHYACSLSQVQQQHKEELAHLHEQLNYYKQDSKEQILSEEFIVSKLKKQLDDMMEKLKQKNEEIEKLQTEKLENERTVHLLKLQIKKLQAEKSEIKQQCNIADKQLSDLQKNVDILIRDNELVKEQLHVTTEELKSKIHKNDLDTDVVELQEKLRVAEEKVAELQSNQEQACKGYSEIKLKLLAHLESQHIYSSEILHDVQAAWDRVSEEVSQTHVILTEEKQDVVNRIAQIGEEKITAEERIKYLENRSRLLSADIKNIIKSSDSLQAYKETTENSASGNLLVKPLHENNEDNKLNKGKPSTVLSKLSHLEDLDHDSVISELSLQKKELDYQVKKLQQQVESYEREIEQFELVRVDWKSERSAVDELLLKLRAQVRQKEQFLSVLIAQKGLLEVKKKEPAESHTEEITDDVSKDDYSLSKLELEIEELTQGNAQLESERDVLWSEKEILLHELKTLHKMYDDLKGKLDCYEGDLPNSTSSLHLCQQCQMNGGNDLFAQLADKDNQLLQLSKEKTAMENSLVELDQQHQEALDHILALKERLTADNKELAYKLELQSEENLMLRKEIKDLQTEQTKLNDLLIKNQALDSEFIVTDEPYFQINAKEPQNSNEVNENSEMNVAKYFMLEEKISFLEMEKSKLDVVLSQIEQDKMAVELEKENILQENVKLNELLAIKQKKFQETVMTVNSLSTEAKYLKTENSNLVSLLAHINSAKHQMKRSLSELHLNKIDRNVTYFDYGYDNKKESFKSLFTYNHTSKDDDTQCKSEVYLLNQNLNEECKKTSSTTGYGSTKKKIQSLKDQSCQTDLINQENSSSLEGIISNNEKMAVCFSKKDIFCKDNLPCESKNMEKEVENNKNESLLETNDEFTLNDMPIVEKSADVINETPSDSKSKFVNKYNLDNVTDPLQQIPEYQNFQVDGKNISLLPPDTHEFNLINQAKLQLNNQKYSNCENKSGVISSLINNFNDSECISEGCDYSNKSLRIINILDDCSNLNCEDKISNRFQYLEEKVRALEFEKAQMLSVLNEKSKECSTLKAEVHRLFGVVSAEKQALVKLQKDNHELTIQKEAEDKEMTRETVHNLCQLIRDKDLEIEALKQKNQTLLAVIQQSTPESSDITSLLQEQDSLVKQLVMFQADREQIINTLNKKHEESVKYHTEVQRLTELLSSELQKYDTLHRDHSLVSQQYEEKQKSLINTQNELMALKQRVTELENQHVDLRQKYSHLLATMNSDTLIHINKEELNAKINEVKQMKENLKEKEKLIYEKDCIIHKMSQTIQRQKEDMDFKDDEMLTLKKHLESLTAQLIEVRNECTLLKEELDSSQQRFSNTLSEIMILKELNERLNITVKEKEFEIKVLQEKVETVTHLIQDNTNTSNEPSDIERLLAENNTLHQRVQLFHQERDEAVLALRQRQQETRDLRNEEQRLKEREERLSSELERLKTHLIQVEDGYTKEVLKAEEREKELRNRLLQAEERAQSSTSAVHNASQQVGLQVESLQEQLRMVAMQRDEALSRICHLEDQVQQQSTSLANLQAVLEQFQKDHHKEIHNVQRSMQIMLDNEKHQIMDLQEELNKKEVQFSETSKALSAANRLSEQLDYKEGIISELKKEVSSKELALRRAHESIGHMKTNTEGKVDRQVMKNLVLGYFGAPLNQKSEVVRLLARVLDFNREEMTKAGIKVGRDNSEERRGFFFSIFSKISPSSGPSLEISTGQSLSALFVQFLENESKPTFHVPLPAEDMAREMTNKNRSPSRALVPSSSPSFSKSSGISLHPYSTDHLLMRPIANSFPTFTPLPVSNSSDDAKSILQEVLK